MSATSFAPCIAIVGPGEFATDGVVADAEETGRLVAARGWTVLLGGRDAGVMRAAARGARERGGIVVGLLPGRDRTDAAPDLTVALATGLGEARNAVIATAADAVVACGTSAGTASEVALAIRAGRPTVLVRPTPEAAAFFAGLAERSRFTVVGSPEEAMTWVARALGRDTG